MKNFIKLDRLAFGIALTVGMWSCSPEIDLDEPTRGTADFSKYIAVGNSLTAGFMDGGLYLEGQQVAFPNLIAEQMQSVGGGSFTSPFFSADQYNGSGYLRLAALVDGNPVTESVTDALAIRGLSPNQTPLYTRYTGGEINNLGVPGMRLDMSTAPGIGSVYGNPYFERLLEENDMTTTYMGFATGQNHSFFSFWLGNNDVLGYAMNGAYFNTEDLTTRLTTVQEFSALYNGFISALAINDRKGVVGTIPDVTAIPFFTTVTTARLQAAVSAATGGQYSDIYIQTASGVRVATADDMFPLTFPTDTLGKSVELAPGIVVPGYGLIAQNPLADNLVLDRDEVQEVSERIVAFNTIIKQVADSKGLAVADAYTYLNQVKAGIVINNIAVSTAYITGNAFSLDGIHLTPMGNAIIANLFIKAINEKYGASIPSVDVTAYRAVIMP